MGAGTECETNAKSNEEKLPDGMQVIKVVRKTKADRSMQVVRLPSFEEVVDDPVLYAHASRVLHLEANPGNARALIQKHGDREVWLNPPLFRSLQKKWIMYTTFLMQENRILATAMRKFLHGK